MKSLLFLVLLLVSGIITLAPSKVHAIEISNQRVIRLTLNDANNSHNSSLEIALEDTIEVELENNGSIGNSWHFSNFSQGEVISLKTSNDGVIKNSPETKPLMGAPTTYVWLLSPVSVGATSIRFIQTDRSGNQSQSIDFNIVVSPEKSDLQ
ncbi:MAG: protease inhibitor I42 family protein [Verrucomicrobia bacterium]|nr:MAG: protease inhibitor I42 family protein [Verrucomicrobiota bacterium]